MWFEKKEGNQLCLYENKQTLDLEFRTFQPYSPLWTRLYFWIHKTKIMGSGPITSWEIGGETVETVSDLFWGAPKSLQMVIAVMKLKDAYSLEGKLRPT